MVSGSAIQPLFDRKLLGGFVCGSFSVEDFGIGCEVWGDWGARERSDSDLWGWTDVPGGPRKDPR